MALLTGVEIKEAYAAQLKQEGRSVSIDVPVGDSDGTVDILTDREIIFCTPTLTTKSALLLKSQLSFYGKFSHCWQKVAVVKQIVDAEAADTLTDEGIAVVSLSVSLSASALSRAPQPPQPTTLQAVLQRASMSPAVQVLTRPIKSIVARDPAFNSAHSVAELKVALLAIGVVFSLGVMGAGVSLVRSQFLSSAASLKEPKPVSYVLRNR
ncbi:MAG: hypothetical protein ACFB16_04340 [Phormidesmis sp.]